MRGSAIAFVALTLALAGCRQKSEPQPDAPEPAPSPTEAVRTEFERLRLSGGFTPDAYVVWGPIWPTRRAEVVVMYDLAAKNAPLKSARELSWVLRPEAGDPLEHRAEIVGNVAVVRVAASKLQSGRFSFRAGDRSDDNCGNPAGLPIVDLSPIWNSAESDHFVYKWMNGDPVGERVREVLVRLERRHKAILGEAKLTGPSDKITFLHYADRDIGFAHQAQRGNNYDWSRNLVFSAEAEDDAHELTHLLFFREVGKHVGLFDEGVAIHIGQELAVGAGWRDRKCDAWALDGLADGRLPPLAELLTPAQMYAKPWSVVGDVFYPAGCSFVASLIEKHGIARLKTFLGAYDCKSQHDAKAVAAAFAKTYGEELGSADRNWRLALTRPR